MLKVIKVCLFVIKTIKPPFNKEAREEAGMTEDWYLPLAKPNKPKVN